MKKYILAVVGLSILVVGVMALTFRMEAGKQENGIEASYKDVKNIYANEVVQVLKGKGNVLKAYKGDVLEMVKANMERYSNDQNLLFKSIAESAGLTVSDKLYTDMSHAYTVAYSKVSASQTDIIDRTRAYKDLTQNSIRGMLFADMMGYPSANADKLMNFLLTNKETVKAFETGMMEDINPLAD